jgi:phytoene dehydrogenase-like protein
MPESPTYDYIILGGGHNGLITQAYLSKAGLRTLCIERRSSVGGGAETMEDPRFPGFLHNTHSFFHRGITNMPWYRDLDLENLGLSYIQPELCTALVRRDGEVLEWWSDINLTVESFARFSKKDSETLLRWRNDFIPIVQTILEPEGRSVPIPPQEREALLQKNAEGRLLLETSRLSPLEFVMREFEHPTIQAGLLFFNGLREVDLRCPGFGHHIPALFASSGRPQMARGGSKNLALALQNAVTQAGGDFLLQSTPEEIVIESGKAIGVKLADGRAIHAKQGVISSLNPQQTFIDLMKPESLSEEWRAKAAGFQYNLIAPLFGLNLNLREAPVYTAAEKFPALNNALMVVLGLETVDQFHDIVKHHEQGTIPPTVMWGCCPSHFDSSQAPAGHHTAFMWEKLPYRLKGDPRNWKQEKDLHGQQMLKLWTEFAPNLDNTVINSFTRSAVDTEQTFPNMQDGDLLVGGFMNDQVGYNRPFPGAGQYQTDIEGLFLCGSSSHPGGNITGLPGYNAAGVILRHSGLSR